MNSKIRPLGDRVVVRRTEAETRTPGGIFIPENAKKESAFGTVLAVGPGKMTDAGQVLPMSVKVGDRVLIAKYGPTEIHVDNEALVLLHESEILGVEDDQAPAGAPPADTQTPETK